MSNLNQSNGGSVIFPNFRRNPFSLNFDWVARRLFWIEDGNSVSAWLWLYLLCLIDQVVL